MIKIFNFFQIIINYAYLLSKKIADFYKFCERIMNISPEVASFYFGIYIFSFGVLYSYLEHSRLWLYIITTVFVLLFPFIGVPVFKSMGNWKK